MMIGSVHQIARNLDVVTETVEEELDAAEDI